MRGLTFLTTSVLCLTLGLGVGSATASPSKASSTQPSAKSTPAETLRPQLPKPSIQPAKAGKKPVRRSQRHSQAASKKDRITELARIQITGRPMRPQAVIEIPKEEPRFKSGTTKYNPRDKQYTRGKK